jgi:hypothetical protein
VPLLISADAVQDRRKARAGQRHESGRVSSEEHFVDRPAEAWGRTGTADGLGHSGHPVPGVVKRGVGLFEVLVERYGIVFRVKDRVVAITGGEALREWATGQLLAFTQ